MTRILWPTHPGSARSDETLVKHLREVSVAGITRTPFLPPGTSFEGICESELIRLVIADLLFSSPIDPSLVDALIIGSARPLGAEVLEEASSTCRLLGCDRYVKAISLGAGSSCDLAALFVAAMKIAAHESRSAIVVGSGVGASLPRDRSEGARTFPSFEVARQYPSSYKERKEYASESKARYQAAILAGQRSALAPVFLPPCFEHVIDADQPESEDTEEQQETNEEFEFRPSLREGLGAVLLSAADCTASGDTTIARRLAGFMQIGLPQNLRGAGAAVALECLAREGEIPIRNIEVFELYEATSAQALSTLKRLREVRGQDPSITDGNGRDRLHANPAGGALAYGFAPSASGIRMLASLMESMTMRKARLGALLYEDPAGEAFALLLDGA